MFPGCHYFQVSEWIVAKNCQKMDKNILILKKGERKDFFILVYGNKYGKDELYQGIGEENNKLFPV